MNITGLGAEEVVGSITINPDTNYFENIEEQITFTNDFPDAMTLRLINGASRYIQRTFNGSTIDDVINIKNSLQTYQQKIATIAKMELDVAILSSIIDQLDSNKSNTDKTALISAGNNILQNDQLNKVADTNNDIEELRKDLSIMKNNLQTLYSQIHTLSQSFQKQGILISNWERDTELTAKIDTETSPLNASASDKKTLTGFSILGNPSIVTLLIGDDLFSRSPARTQQIIKTKRNFITYYQLRAQYISFAESRKASTKYSIHADINKFKNELGPILKNEINFTDLFKQISLTIDGLYGAVSASNTTGIFNAIDSNVSLNYLTSFDDVRYQDFNNTVPIISMRANLSEMLKKYQTETKK